METKVILLVEDNADDEALTLRALKKNNITNSVTVVRDGAEALDYLFGTGEYAGKALSQLPQLTLLDLKLPKVDGLEVLRRLRERQVKRIVVVCTHGLFTGKAIARLAAQPEIVEIVTTDTVPVPPEKRLPNMKVLSIAPLLADTIRRIHLGESVSELFDV